MSHSKHEFYLRSKFDNKNYRRLQTHLNVLCAIKIMIKPGKMLFSEESQFDCLKLWINQIGFVILQMLSDSKQTKISNINIMIIRANWKHLTQALCSKQD